MAGVDHVFWHLRQPFGCHHQDFSAMFSQRAARNWTRQDAGQVQRFDAAERTRTFRHWLRIAIADLYNFDNRFRRQHLAVRCCQPFIIGAHHAATGTNFVNGVFKVHRIPLGDGGRDGGRGQLAIQQLQHPCLQVGQVEMRQDMAAILGGVGLGYLHHLFMRWVHNGFERTVWPWPLQIACAAKGSGGMADIDRRLLPLAGFQLPNVVDRNANTAEHSSRRFANLEARGYDWVSACNSHFVSARRAQAANGYDFIECSCHGAWSFT